MYVEDIQRALRVMGPRFVQIYGQGESPMTITALSRQQLMDTQHPQYLARLGSVGVAQSAVELRVTDAQGRDLPCGETGEVVLRGDSVMAGYWRDAAATAHTLRDGWLFTGDMGSLDAQGFLTLRDRSKDVIISGGSNIYPREVEEALLRHPGVAEVSVIGRARQRLGRGRGRLRRALRGRPAGAVDARRGVPRAHRPLQAPQGIPPGRRLAQEPLRQGAQDRAARAAGSHASALTPPHSLKTLETAP